MMALTTLTRSVVKLEYSAVRLPFSLLEEHVVSRYLDDEARLRLGFERALGSLDSVAGWLLADDDIARRGQVLRRRTQFLAKASDLEEKARARRADAKEKLQAGQAQARRAREQAREEMGEEVTAAFRQEQEHKQEVQHDADAWAGARKNQAEQTAEKRAAAAETAKRAAQERVSAQEERVTAGARRQLSDAAGKHRSAQQHRQEADRMGRLAEKERNARRSS
jgi:hypothetical protein